MVRSRGDADAVDAASRPRFGREPRQSAPEPVGERPCPAPEQLEDSREQQAAHNERVEEHCAREAEAEELDLSLRAEHEGDEDADHDLREQILDVLIDAALGRRRVVAADAHDAKAPRPRLSARERSVLELLNLGWSADEIAMLASMTPSDVEAHMASARRKLAAITNSDAIAAAEAWGLLDPGAS